MNGLSAPMALLLDILKPDADPPLHALNTREWHSAASAALQHSVAPLFWHRLVERGVADLVPGAVRDEVQLAHASSWYCAQTWMAQLRELLPQFQDHGVPVVLLKGAFLATHVYPDAALRPMGDLDLLLPADRMRDGRDALFGIGYSLRSMEKWTEWEEHRTHRHPPPLIRDGRLSIELHDTIEPCSAPFSMPLADTWEHALPCEGRLSSALTLSPEGLLLHLATHMGRSHLLGSSLVRVCDVAFWTNRFGCTADWDGVVNRAEAGGMRRFVYTALELSRRLLGTPFPPDVRYSLRASGDDAAVDQAVALLDARRMMVAGTISFTRSDRPLIQRLAKAGRALLLPPGIQRALRFATETGRVPEDDHATFVSRWQSLLHLVRHPSEASRVLGTVRSVRDLRAWAEEP